MFESAENTFQINPADENLLRYSIKPSLGKAGAGKEASLKRTRKDAAGSFTN